MTAVCTKGVESLSSGTNEGEAYTQFWAAVLVKINTEKKVSEKLNALGIHTYLPVQSEYHKWSDRRKKIDRIVIPMIVFVKIDRTLERRLLTYSYIYKFISYPGQSHAAAIPDYQIERLKYMLNQSDMKVEFNSCKFEIGDEVEIARGPLKGLSGRLCYVDNGKPLIGIYLDMLGYACVTIDKNDVEIKNKAI